MAYLFFRRCFMRLIKLALLTTFLVILSWGFAGHLKSTARAWRLETKAINKTFTVDGIERTAMVYANSTEAAKTGAPIVFFFHGHGGTAQFIDRRYGLNALWREAVCVYPQGLTGV